MGLLKKSRGHQTTNQKGYAKVEIKGKKTPRTLVNPKSILYW